MDRLGAGSVERLGSRGKMGEEVGLKVAIRIRPQKASEGKNAWEYNSEEGTINLIGADGEVLQDKKSAYRYDAVFGEKSQTSEIYESVVRELVAGVIKGVNGN